MNAPTAALLRSRLHRLLSGSLILLTVRGRRTGQNHTFPVMYARSGAVLYIVPAGHELKVWWRNLLTPAPVTILLAGREMTGVARTYFGSESPEVVAEAMKVCLARFPAFARMTGLKVAGGEIQGTAAQLRAAVARAVVVRVELEQPVIETAPD